MTDSPLRNEIQAGGNFAEVKRASLLWSGTLLVFSLTAQSSTITLASAAGALIITTLAAKIALGAAALYYALLVALTAAQVRRANLHLLSADPAAEYAGAFGMVASEVRRAMQTLQWLQGLTADQVQSGEGYARFPDNNVRAQTLPELLTHLHRYMEYLGPRLLKERERATRVSWSLKLQRWLHLWTLDVGAPLALAILAVVAATGALDPALIRTGLKPGPAQVAAATTP